MHLANTDHRSSISLVWRLSSDQWFQCCFWKKHQLHLSAYRSTRCSRIRYQANSAFCPSWVSKWGPASAGKEKAGMVHFVSGWTWGMQVKLWDPLRTRAIPERLRGVFMTRRYTNLVYLTLSVQSCSYHVPRAVCAQEFRSSNLANQSPHQIPRCSTMCQTGGSTAKMNFAHFRCLCCSVVVQFMAPSRRQRNASGLLLLPKLLLLLLLLVVCCCHLLCQQYRLLIMCLFYPTTRS